MRSLRSRERMQYISEIKDKEILIHVEENQRNVNDFHDSDIEDLIEKAIFILNWQEFEADESRQLFVTAIDIFDIEFLINENISNEIWYT